MLVLRYKSFIADVQWSPVHPAVFVVGSLDHDGELQLWNLNTNSEKPVMVQKIGRRITRVLWSKNG